VRQKEICRLRCILPDQSKTVFPAKLQKLGVGGILTFLATLYILCFFRLLSFIFLAFQPSAPTAFCPTYVYDLPNYKMSTISQTGIFGGGEGAVLPPLPYLVCL
jgi:hypothetical protein